MSPVFARFQLFSRAPKIKMGPLGRAQELFISFPESGLDDGANGLVPLPSTVLSQARATRRMPLVQPCREKTAMVKRLLGAFSCGQALNEHLARRFTVLGL